MESLGVVFAMLIAIVTSGVIVRVLPWSIPLPLIQIALGMVIAGFFQEGITLSPDVFFLLFLPPLLFLDGWRIPKDALQRDRLSIFQLAFGLVLITVFGLGFLIHWMIPSMPLAVAFALAAIVSPTDPVAVAGIARRLAIPRRIMTVLEGEALFNDASGLVAFRMAVLVMMTGSFSLSSAITSFLWVSIAGILTGIIVTWTLSFFRKWFTAKFGEELGSEVLLSLLTPFAAYVLAEHLNASGILSAVAAGLTMSHMELSGQISALTRMRRSAIWDTIQFTLNGVMFVLLGEQLPDIFKNAVHVVQQTGHHNPWWLLIYATVICLSLAALRFIWIFISIHITKLIKKTPTPLSEQAKLRDILILSLGGVRGAVTLAGVLTLPLLLPSNEAFPSRDLAIFLAATVIIISLITASISLPLLLKSSSHSHPALSPFDEQRQRAIQKAKYSASENIKHMLQHSDMVDPTLGDEYYQDLCTKLLTEFEHNLQSPSDQDTLAQIDYAIERKIRLAIIQSARQSIYKQARDRKISDEVAREIVKQLDYDEVRFN